MAQTAEEIPDKLEVIFDLQKDFVRMAKSDRYPGSREEKISVLCTAIMHEAMELQRTTNWKWWKTATAFDEKQAREELIDVWHFVVQASLELGLTTDDLLEEYKRKNAINRDRQSAGY